MQPLRKHLTEIVNFLGSNLIRSSNKLLPHGDWQGYLAYFVGALTVFVKRGSIYAP